MAPKEVSEAGEREDREKAEKDGEMDRTEDTSTTKEVETTAGAEMQKVAANKSK